MRDAVTHVVPRGGGELAVSTTERARLVLTASIVVTALLYIVPYGRVLAYPLMLLSTLFHEMGHGVTAVLVGAHFDRFEMWADGSGVAYLRTDGGRITQAVIAIGGLIGPAVVGALGFAAARTRRGAQRALVVLIVGLLLACLLVVRNPFGMLFTLTLVGLCALVVRIGSSDLAQLTVVFLSVQLALSVFSRSDYLFTPYATTARGRMPSDVGQIEQALFFPYWFWGALCGLLSIAVLLLGLRLYWRER
ncbi:MAG: M50 family metallopeptidase [Acidobacteriota bacterium]